MAYATRVEALRCQFGQETDTSIALQELADLAGTGKGHMGERLPCTIPSVTEVRAVTEETLAVRAVGSAMLAPHTVTQVRVIVLTPRA